MALSGNPRPIYHISTTEYLPHSKRAQPLSWGGALARVRWRAGWCVGCIGASTVACGVVCRLHWREGKEGAHRPCWITSASRCSFFIAYTREQCHSSLLFVLLTGILYTNENAGGGMTEGPRRGTRSRIFSSIEFCVMSRKTFTGFVCPSLCARSCACRSICGFQSES